MGKGLIKFVGWVAFLAISAACAHKEPVVVVDGKEVPAPNEIGFEMVEKDMVDMPAPLPDKKNIYAVWHYRDGRTKSVLSYRGWDFNGDKRIDMLEVLDLEGKNEAMAFDFDGDGKIDMLKKREEKEFDISQAVNMPTAPPSAIIAH